MKINQFGSALNREIRKYYEYKRQIAETVAAERRDEYLKRFPRLGEYRRKLWELRGESIGVLTDPEQRADIERRIDDLIAERDAYMREHRIPDDYDKPRYECPECDDTGVIGDRLCDCANRALREIQRREGDYLPPEDQTFANFDETIFVDRISPEWYDGKVTPRAGARALRGFSQSYIADFSPEQQNMYLCGDVGTGKSFLLGCIGNALMEQGHTVFYIRADELFDVFGLIRVQNSRFNPDESERARLNKILDRAYGSEALLIDDLGIEQLDDAGITDFMDLLEARREANKPIIIASNLKPQGLIQRYGERIYSRITGSSIMRLLNGPDLRKILRRRRTEQH